MPGIDNNVYPYNGQVPYPPWYTWPYSNYPYKPLPQFTPYSDYAPLYPIQNVAPAARVAPTLAYSPKPAWSWDIGLPVSSANPRPPVDVLAAPAIIPIPTTETIAIISPLLPWTITVKAGADPDSRPPGAPATFISTGDVLAAIHKNVRLPVAQAEFDTLLSRDQQYWIGVDFRIRCGGNESEYRQGLRRMDFIGARRKFLGLSSWGPDVWILHLS